MEILWHNYQLIRIFRVPFWYSATNFSKIFRFEVGSKCAIWVENAIKSSKKGNSGHFMAQSSTYSNFSSAILIFGGKFFENFFGLKLTQNVPNGSKMPSNPPKWAIRVILWHNYQLIWIFRVPFWYSATNFSKNFRFEIGSKCAIWV